MMLLCESMESMLTFNIMIQLQRFSWPWIIYQISTSHRPIQMTGDGPPESSRGLLRSSAQSLLMEIGKELALVQGDVSWPSMGFQPSFMPASCNIRGLHHADLGNWREFLFLPSTSGSMNHITFTGLTCKSPLHRSMQGGMHNVESACMSLTQAPQISPTVIDLCVAKRQLLDKSYASLWSWD